MIFFPIEMMPVYTYQQEIKDWDFRGWPFLQGKFYHGKHVRYCCYNQFRLWCPNGITHASHPHSSGAEESELGAGNENPDEEGRQHAPME